MRRLRHSMRAGISAIFPLLIAAIVACGLAIFLSAGAHAAPASLLGGPEPGKHIYDTTGVLTSAEIATLETHAKAVEQAGVPTIVYLQAKNASYDQTYQDAGNLMNAWNVESSPGARDGFVMFLNLEPGNLHHGEVVLFAGQKYFRNGPLTHDETQRIYQDEMLPLLRTGDLAGGIAAGLDAVAHDLIYGPPPPPRPSAFQQAVGGWGTILLSALAVIFALGVSLLSVTMRGRLPQPVPAMQARVTPPSDLPPALVGALVVGHTGEAQMEATVLDFARRGLLAIEPAGASTLQIRLLGDGHSLHGYEANLWQGLESLASLASLATTQRLIPSTRMSQVREQFGPPLAELRRELIDRGWYDPEIAAKRMPFYWAGILGSVGTAIALLAALIGLQPWALVPAAIFLAGAIWMFVKGAQIPSSTAEGEAAAAPWREYRSGILAVHLDHAQDADLGTALPYAVAMGIVNALDYRLQLASERGEVPSWFVRSLAPAQAGTRRTIYPGFYPYWLIWHSSMYPPSSASSGGGFAGGGAAGGGGGGGGHF